MPAHVGKNSKSHIFLALLPPTPHQPLKHLVWALDHFSEDQVPPAKKSGSKFHTLLQKANLGRGRRLLRLEAIPTKISVASSPVPIVDTSEPSPLSYRKCSRQSVAFELGLFKDFPPAFLRKAPLTNILAWRPVTGPGNVFLQSSNLKSHTM